MFAAAREMDAALGQPFAQLDEIDGFPGGLNILDALNEIHAVQVQEDMTGEYGERRFSWTFRAPRRRTVKHRFTGRRQSICRWGFRFPVRLG